jgi:hypothetical protein
MFGDILIKILLGELTKLLTAELLEKLALALLHFIAKQTENDLDDKIVASIAEALGKKDWYKELN